MRKLKCSDCGGNLQIETTTDGLIFGRCAHCQGEFLVEPKGRHHVIVEHRFPTGTATKAPTKAPLNRRGLMLGGAALFGGAVALPVISGLFRPSRQPQTPDQKPATVVFNVGGEGAEPGQFWDNVFEIGIDSLSRAVLVDNKNHVYVFGPEGNFITHYTQPDGVSRKFCGLLPSGDVIFADSTHFVRLDLETGKIKATVPTPNSSVAWGALHYVTADGGLAIYASEDPFGSGNGSEPAADTLIFLGPDLREKRKLQGLLRQAIAAHPMASEAPIATSFVVDNLGTISLNVFATEDHDPRGGIYEFNADGVFQRRIALEQKRHGQIVFGQDNSLWYGDPWMSDLQNISAAGIKRLALNALGEPAGVAPGNLAALARYPNGDLGLATMNHRFLRVRPQQI